MENQFDFNLKEKPQGEVGSSEINQNANQGQPNGFNPYQGGNQGQPNGFNPYQGGNQGQPNGFNPYQGGNQGQPNGFNPYQGGNQGQPNGFNPYQGGNQGQQFSETSVKVKTPGLSIAGFIVSLACIIFFFVNYWIVLIAAITGLTLSIVGYKSSKSPLGLAAVIVSSIVLAIAIIILIWAIAIVGAIVNSIV